MNDLALPLMLLAFVSIPTYLCGREWRTRYYLWREGVSLPARVLFLWEWSLGLTHTYYVLYEIEGEGADGEPFYFTRQAEISKEQFLALEDGAELTAYYAPSHPELYRLEEQPSNLFRLTIGTLIAWGYMGFLVWVIM